MEEARAANAKLSSVDAERFTELYGSWPGAREAYTIVVDGTHLGRDEVLAAVIEHCEATA